MAMLLLVAKAQNRLKDAAAFVRARCGDRRCDRVKNRQSCACADRILNR